MNEPGRAEALEEMLNWVEYEVLSLPRPSLEILLVADDEYFAGRAHHQRSNSEGRKYVGAVADIHEASVPLQIKVNSYFAGQKQDHRYKQAYFKHTT